MKIYKLITFFEIYRNIPPPPIHLCSIVFDWWVMLSYLAMLIFVQNFSSFLATTLGNKMCNPFAKHIYLKLARWKWFMLWTNYVFAHFFVEGGGGPVYKYGVVVNFWSQSQFWMAEGGGGWRGSWGDGGGGATKPSKTRFSDHFRYNITVSLTADTNAYLITYLFHDAILHNLDCKLAYVLFLLTYFFSKITKKKLCLTSVHRTSLFS